MVTALFLPLCVVSCGTLWVHTTYIKRRFGTRTDQFLKPRQLNMPLCQAWTKSLNWHFFWLPHHLSTISCRSILVHRLYIHSYSYSNIFIEFFNNSATIWDQLMSPDPGLPSQPILCSSIQNSFTLCHALLWIEIHNWILKFFSPRKL